MNHLVIAVMVLESLSLVFMKSARGGSLALGSDAYYWGCYPLSCLKFDYDVNIPDFVSTPNSCRRKCKDKGYYIAGLYNLTKCSCSCYQDCPSKLDDSVCGLPCRSDAELFCGGYTAVSLYRVPETFHLSSSCGQENGKDGLAPLIPILVTIITCLFIVITGIVSYRMIRHRKAHRSHSPTKLEGAGSEQIKEDSLLKKNNVDCDNSIKPRSHYVNVDRRRAVRPHSHYEKMDSRRPVSVATFLPRSVLDTSAKDRFESTKRLCQNCRRFTIGTASRKSSSGSNANAVEVGKTRHCTSATDNDATLDPWCYSTSRINTRDISADDYGYVELDKVPRQGMKNPDTNRKNIGATRQGDIEAPLLTRSESWSRCTPNHTTVMASEDGEEGIGFSQSVTSDSSKVYSRHISRSQTTLSHVDEASEDSDLASESLPTYMSLRRCYSHAPEMRMSSNRSTRRNSDCIQKSLPTDSATAGCYSSITTRTLGASPKKETEDADTGTESLSKHPASKGKSSRVEAKPPSNESVQAENELDSDSELLTRGGNDRSQHRRAMTPNDPDKDIAQTPETGLIRKESYARKAKRQRFTMAKISPSGADNDNDFVCESQSQAASSDHASCFVIHPKTRMRPSIPSLLLISSSDSREESSEMNSKARELEGSSNQ